MDQWDAPDAWFAQVDPPQPTHGMVVSWSPVLPGELLLPHHNTPGLGQCWGCCGDGCLCTGFTCHGWVGAPEPTPLVARGCWCLMGVCSSLPAPLLPPSAPCSCPPHSSAQFKDKREPTGSPAPATHPPKDLESSIPLCAAPGTWSLLQRRQEGPWAKGGGTATSAEICQEDAGGSPFVALGADPEATAWCALLQLCLPPVLAWCCRECG